MQSTVDEVLAGAPLEVPGRVLSGPVDLWPGLVAGADALAEDLQRAGYARVDDADAPGDFSVHENALRVITRGASQGDAPAADALITFRDGRIAAISPGDGITLPPTLLASVRGPGNEDRAPKPLDHFPETLQQAVLAMEDGDFWEHRGVSPWGILRAVVRNTLAGETVQGGSTLTQQLAKNLFLSPERTYTRKAREVLFAFALEQRLDKPELLTLYLNQVYWGQVNGAAICGAEQAALAYFGKPADRLSVGEAAALGGIISAPNSYHPLRHPERAKTRRDLAIRRMVDEGWLAPHLAEAALLEPLRTAPPATGRRAPYAVDAAIDAAEDALGAGAVARMGLTVRTAIHPPLQRLAEQVLRESLPALEAEHPEAEGVQAALVAVRASDGAILAMVGGRDYAASQFNRATQAQRQPGSTVKPLTLLAAFEENRRLSPSSTLNDAPISRRYDGRTWSPSNYDGGYAGAISVRSAIARSRNVPAVLLAEEVGFDKLKRWFVGLGLSGATSLPSASLGAFEASPVELAGAYTVFPGAGRYAAPRLLTAITRPDDARPLLAWHADTRPIASPRATALATSVLGSVLTDGTGRRAAEYGATGALGGKTGTTDAYRDAWFVGFTPEIVVAVWVGFDDGRSHGLTGSQAALPVWSRFVAGLHVQADAFARPADVVEAEVCVGGFDDGQCLECATELFSAGEAPEGGCGDPGEDPGASAGAAASAGADSGREDPGDAAMSEAIEELVERRRREREDDERRGLFRRR